MLWTPPSKEKDDVYLPLTQGNPEKAIETCNVVETFKVSLQNAEKNCWFTPDLSSEETIASTLVQLVKLVGRLIQNGQQNVEVYTKTAPYDLVTEMDIGVELIIRYWFKKHLPNHKIIGEEKSKPILSPTDTIWYLDPIDGTKNYTEGSPNYCINLGSSHNNSPYINIIYAPSLGSLWYSTPTTSSYSGPTQQTNHLCTEFYPEKVDQATLFETIQSELKTPIFKTKAMGVSLLKIIEGKGSYFYKPNVKPWDIVAPMGILAHSSFWDMELITKDNINISLFSHDPTHINYLNNCFKGNCRIGIITLTPRSETGVKKHLQRLIQNHVRQYS